MIVLVIVFVFSFFFFVLVLYLVIKKFFCGNIYKNIEFIGKGVFIFIGWSFIFLVYELMGKKIIRSKLVNKFFNVVIFIVIIKISVFLLLLFV